jgi:hypothetical protein
LGRSRKCKRQGKSDGQCQRQVGFFHSNTSKEACGRTPPRRAVRDPGASGMTYPDARQGAQGKRCQAARGGPRGAAAPWWAPYRGAACGAHASAGGMARASVKSAAAGGGASPPCDSRHKAQCMPGPAPGGGLSAGALLWPAGQASSAMSPLACAPVASANTVRGPLLLHTSMPWAGAGTSAPVTSGASVPNAISPSASQAQARVRTRLSVRVRRRISCMVFSGCKSRAIVQKVIAGFAASTSVAALALAFAQGLVGALCMPCGCAPASLLGAAMATGTLRSSVLSTPLASLKRRVTGMVVSFCKGTFRSISIR